MALMDSAELIMNDNPERAYALMDSIDSSTIHRRSLQARYALLYTEVQYKNYIDVTNDSLVMTAVKYYSINKDKLSRFRSLYILGCIYVELGRYSDAAVSLSEAEMLVEYIDDIYRLGLLYTQLGIVFSKTYDYHRAEIYFTKSLDYYIQSGKVVHKAYATYEIASSKMNQHDFKEGDSIMMEVENWARCHNDMSLYSKSLISRFSCNLYMNDVDSATVIKDRYKLVFGEFINEPLSLGLMSFYYTLKHDFNEASVSLHQAWNQVLSITDSINLYYYSSLLAGERGLSDSALYYSKIYMNLQNENLGYVLRQPVVTAQKDHFQSLTEIELLKNRQNKLIILALSLISILIVLIIVIYHYFHVKQIELELEDKRSVIDELKRLDYLNTEKIVKLTTEINRQDQELTASRTALNELFKAKQKNVDTIEHLKREVFYQNRERYGGSDHLFSIYYDSGENISVVRQQLALVVNALKEEYLKPENLNRLDKMINESNDNVIDRIREVIKPMKEKELNIIRFSFAKLSLKAIGIIIDEKTDNVYQIKSRLMKKIKENSDELWLEMRRVL